MLRRMSLNMINLVLGSALDRPHHAEQSNRRSDEPIAAGNCTLCAVQVSDPKKRVLTTMLLVLT